MSRFLQYMDEVCDGTGSGSKDGTGKKKRKRKGKENIDENYMAGQGFKDIDQEVAGLTNVLVGWPKDIANMIGYGNHKGALESLKRFKTKVIPDIEKAIKAEMKKK